MLQTSDFARSNQYCHYKSDNYIIIPRMHRSEEKARVLLNPPDGWMSMLVCGLLTSSNQSQFIILTLILKILIQVDD